MGSISGCEGFCILSENSNVMDGETTIKVKFASLRGAWGRKEDRPKTLFLMGNTMTIEFQILLSNFVVIAQAPRIGGGVQRGGSHKSRIVLRRSEQNAKF